MIRITKLADYAIVLLTFFARAEDGTVLAATDLAERAHLPVPTVSKVLKALARSGLLESHRGIKGGYQLARGADQITVAEILAVMDGPVGLTECAGAGGSGCEIQRVCPVREHWRRINDVVRGALSTLTLSEMAKAPSGRPRRRAERPLRLLGARR